MSRRHQRRCQSMHGGLDGWTAYTNCGSGRQASLQPVNVTMGPATLATYASATIQSAYFTLPPPPARCTCTPGSQGARAPTTIHSSSPSSASPDQRNRLLRPAFLRAIAPGRREDPLATGERDAGRTSVRLSRVRRSAAIRPRDVGTYAGHDGRPGRVLRGNSDTAWSHCFT